jgi:hypothetical protein
METLEYPTTRKVYDWRCINSECNAKMRAFKGDAAHTLNTKSGPQLEFKCPHCKWHTTVPE